jgi:hypothetical protein
MGNVLRAALGVALFLWTGANLERFAGIPRVHVLPFAAHLHLACASVAAARNRARCAPIGANATGGE